jgi:hypothetical protein
MSDEMKRLLAGFDRRDEPEDDVDPADLWTQIDALAGERAERNDPHWLPPGGSGEAALARLVERRHAQGVLWRPPKRRRTR